MQTTSNVLLLLAFALGAPAAAQRLIAVDTVSGSATVYELDPATGARTLLGSMSPAAAIPAALAYDYIGGRMFMSGNGTDSVYEVDLTNWQTRLIGAYGNAAVVMSGLEWDSSTGTLYGVSGHNGGFYSIDSTTGAATLVGLSGLGSATNGYNLCYDLLHDTMLMVSATTDSLYSIDRTSGTATLIGPMTGITNAGSMAFDLGTATMYVLDNLQDRLYMVDVSTGQATVVGPVATSNMIGLAYVPGAGRLSRQAHACGPTTITPSGSPTPGGTVTSTLGGITGLPFVGFGLTGVTQTFCGCTIGHDWLAVVGGSVAAFAIPQVTSMIGLQIYVQGADFLGTGGCANPQFAVTDTVTISIG